MHINFSIFAINASLVVCHSGTQLTVGNEESDGQVLILISHCATLSQYSDLVITLFQCIVATFSIN